MGNKNEFCFEQTKIVSDIPPNKVITGNNSYLLLQDKGKFIIIYDMDNKINLKIKSCSTIIKMHPKLENVFILAEKKIAKIFEITKNECKERIKINGHTKKIKLVEFSKHDDKIFATYSNDNTLKIWKLDNAFCMSNILMVDTIDYFQIYENYIYYFNETDSCITRYDYNANEEFNYNSIKESNFIVLNKEEIATINDESILIKYSKNNEKKELELKDFAKQMFYDEKLNYLYIFIISGMNVIDMITLEEKYYIAISYLKVIYLNNHIGNKELYANFIIFKKNIEYYSLYSGSDNKSNLNFRVKISTNDFWEKTIPSLWNIENLEWKSNCEENCIYKKKYLDIKSISEELDSNYSKDLEVKKKEVENEINTNKNFDYIQLLKMIIKDNTNKTLVIKYLKFLENNEKQINFDEKESFKDEYEKYKSMFTNEELKLKELKINSHSQKEIFISLLNDIMDLFLRYGQFQKRCKF